MKRTKLSFFSAFALAFALCFGSLSVSSLAQSSSNSKLTTVDSTAGTIPTLRSLLISQSDSLIFENYYGETTARYPYNIKSASKSIISLLIGIAIDKEFIPSVNEPISTYFGYYFEQHPDSFKQNITVGDLLSMRSGLETTSFGNYGRWIISKHWVEHILKKPLVDSTKSDMLYSTGSSHLLSAILTKATGMSTRKFAEIYLFYPLNIRIGGWDKDPQGIYMGGNNLALSPIDMLKIGRLILNKGQHNGKEIVSQQWIDVSLQPYTSSPFNGHKFGYSWWSYSYESETIYFAWGFGGQFIFILPHLSAVVITTSTIRPSDKNRSYKESVFDLMEEFVFPSLEKSLSNN